MQSGTSMHPPDLLPFQRERFHSDSDSPAQAALARTVLQLLLHQDGSTTRLLEVLAGGAIAVHVLEQGLVRELPSQLEGSLPGNTFLRRLTALEAGGRVLLDSVSYIAVERLPRAVVHGLEEGTRPIGHILARLWTRRSFRDQDTQLFEQLWARTGQPDPRASRSCVILTPEGPCMVLAETFRRGVLEAIGAAWHPACSCGPL